MNTHTIRPTDRETMRALAGRVRQIAELAEMTPRRERLRRHNTLQSDRPIILAFPEGSWDELVPFDQCVCENESLRYWELQLRRTIYAWESIGDDAAVEPYFNLNWTVHKSGYGVDIPHIHAEGRGSYIWDPPIKDLSRDMEKLHFRELTFDRETSERTLELASEVFGDLLPVRRRGSHWWTMGLTWEAAKLIGLENLMLYMLDDPEGMHRLMQWVSDEHMHFITWHEEQGLLTQNNDGDYIGSGGFGYTDELPQPDLPAGAPARLIDRWGFAESQETVGISPAMFGEFVLPYQLPLLEKFGLNCYGCCEGLQQRIDMIMAKVPRLRRVSVSPFADQKIMAEKLAGKYVYSRKPNPAHVCCDFNEDAIREDLRFTLDVAGDQPIEIILKDTHTVENQPDRIGRWVRIALEEVDRYMDTSAAAARSAAAIKD